MICRNFSDLGISPGMQVVAYDADSGMYAARLWWMLRWMGHDAVAVLDGGIARWQREGHPVRGGVESSTQGNFKGSPRPGWRLTVDEVLEGPRRSAAAARRFAHARALSRHRTKRSIRSAATFPAQPTISSSRTSPRTRPSSRPTTSRPSGRPSSRATTPATSSSIAAQA